MLIYKSKNLHFGLLAFLLFYSFYGISQETKTITLIFKDSDNGGSISNLKLSVLNSDKIFSTTEDGLINFPCMGYNVNVFASHLSYVSLDTFINFNVSKDTLYFTMDRITYALPEIRVTANEVPRKKEDITIVHCEYVNQDLCVFYKKEDTSIVSTFSSDWLKVDKRLDGDIKEIYRLDNSENVYFDMGNEIQMHTYTTSNFSLTRRIKYELNQFDKIKDVIGQYNEYWIYVNYTNFNQSLEVICYNRINDTRKILYKIDHVEGIQAANVHLRDLV